MITLKIEVTADTEEHLYRILEDVNRSFRQKNRSVEAWYIWPNSYFKLQKEGTDDTKSS